MATVINVNDAGPGKVIIRGLLMKTFKVLGSGCKKCEKTAALIRQIADEQGAEVSVVKETNPEQFMHYGVMSTPAVVMDEALVHAGSIPHREAVAAWLSA